MKVYLIGRPHLNSVELSKFTEWASDSYNSAQALCETAGRVCYMSFENPQRGNKEYLKHILEVGHGSVLEHASWSFIIEGVSRSLTHELVRHRIGFSYSQLSQRYVDESDVEFICPDLIANNPALLRAWQDAIDTCKRTYAAIANALNCLGHPRKICKQTARSVLPNCTETKIFVTANARALRNFFELRCNIAADTEMHALAEMMLRMMQEEAPNIFGDYEIGESCHTDYRKV